LTAERRKAMARLSLAVTRMVYQISRWRKVGFVAVEGTRFLHPDTDASRV
jgi:hypothetical protein